MVVSDTGKVALLALVIAGLFLLTLVGKAESAVTIPAITGLIGIIIGNGKAAMRGHAPTPMIVSSVSPEEVVTIHGSYPVERTDGDEGIGPSDS